MGAGTTKELRAKVKLDARDAEGVIRGLTRRINDLNKAVQNANKIATSTNKIAIEQQKLNQQMAKTQMLEEKVRTQKQKTAEASQKVATATTKSQIAEQKLVAQTARTKSIVDKINSTKQQTVSKTTAIVNKVRQWATAQKQVSFAARSTNSVLSSIWSKLKGIASTYLGIMGMRAVIDTSDAITSAENKLNYVSSQQLGAAGTNADGTYSAATLNATQEAMDKMYASSQKVRMNYTDMMSNVSKFMTLAGGAFQNNIDNAIRFQEIMAEAYAVGGATAEEMHSSMYQLTQALASGTLAGDELRSVREGAPLAYKAIEEFVQGVYDTDESLKELGSQGKVTADMVVAAIMTQGDALDKAFAQTEQTFAQTWTQIKNSAVQAFRPVSEMLRKALNAAVDNGMIQKFEDFFWNVSKGIMIVMEATKKAINWIADNWYWLSDVVARVISVIIAYYLVMGAIAVKSAIKSAVAFVIVHWVLILIVGAIVSVIYALYAWQKGTIDTCKLIEYAFIALAIVIMVILAKILFAWLVAAGIITAGVAWIVLAVVAAVLVLWYFIIKFFAEVCGGVWVALTFIGNLIQSLINFIVGCITVVVAFIANVIAFIVNLIGGCVSWVVTLIGNSIQTIINFGSALWQNICAIATNIGIAFQNAWAGITSSFWNMIADLLSGLSALEGPINAILKAFGKEPISISATATSLRNKGGTQQSYVSLPGFSGVSAFNEGWSGDAWNKGWNTLNFIDFKDAWQQGSSVAGTGLSDWSLSEAYNTGYTWGSGVENRVNQLGNSYKDKFKNSFTNSEWSLDNIGKSLGLDFNNMAGGNEANDVAGAYDYPDELLGGVGGIADDIGSIKDSMDLTEEDLGYLRKLAAMEWTKEYTTANITVDMSNYNTINSDMDLDGIVTTLADKLYEEMDYMANGVYD